MNLLLKNKFTNCTGKSTSEHRNIDLHKSALNEDTASEVRSSMKYDYNFNTKECDLLLRVFTTESSLHITGCIKN